MATVERLLVELEKLDPHYGLRITPGSAWIRCPNPEHKGGNERTPSLKVNLNAAAAAIGAFNCFGCSYSGSWNRLARQLKLSKFTSLYDDTIHGVGDQIDNELLGSEQEPAEMIGGMPWPKQVEWRGIPGKLVNKVGGRHYFDHSIQRPRLYLPVYTSGQLVGGIKCLLEPDPKGQVLKYQNTPGKWVKRNFFPYDYVKAQDTKVIVLVEGPRDALNLLSSKIMALSNLGSLNSWSSKKLQLLLDLDPQLVVLGFDPDRAGQEATQAVKQELAEWLPVKRLKLPNGRDPGKLSKRQLNQLRDHLEQRRR